MERYDYLSAVKDDVRAWIEDNDYLKSDFTDENGKWLRDENRDDVEEFLNDSMWAVDSVTGNASGSYTFSTWQAEENLCHNLDLLGEALEEFGYYSSDSIKSVMESAETCDVTIRCYLLRQAISEVLDEIMEEDEDDE